MNDSNNIYDKILEILGEVPGNLTVMEQQIDAGVQSEYYYFAESMDKNLDPEKVLHVKDNLFKRGIPLEEKKKLLIQLAAIGNVESFRTLENFVKSHGHGLSEWAALALQESRLLLESKILDENRVLISTGLGGKGLNVRYFTVLLTRSGKRFSQFERKLVASEIRFSLKCCRGELESIKFDRELCTVLSVIPLKVPIQELFDSIIKECNHYDDFLNHGCLISNVKVLTNKKIRKMIRGIE